MHFLRHLTAELTGDAFKAGYTPLNQAEQLTHLGEKAEKNKVTASLPTCHTEAHAKKTPTNHNSKAELLC